MKERDFTTKFLKWIKAQTQETCVFEIKICKGSSLPFEAVKVHQEAALYHASHGTIVFKIPDFGGQNPFDGFMICKQKAYVVIYFYKPRRQSYFYLIPIDAWMKEKETSTRKSLTEERVGQIGLTATLGNHS